MLLENKYFLTSVSVFIALVILGIDLNIPLGVAAGVLYVFVILISAQLNHIKALLAFGVLCTLFIIIGFFYSTEGGNTLDGSVNRILSILAVWTTVWLSFSNQAANQISTDRYNRNKAIFDSSLNCMIIIDQLGAIEAFNPAAEILFGYKLEEVLGKNIKMLMPEPFHSAHDRYLSDYRKTGEKKIIGNGREVSALKHDGTIFPIQLTVAEAQLSKRNIYIGTIRDITHVKLAENALTNAKEAAEEANMAKSQFLANMSHELRTPLNAIIGYSEMLLEDSKNEQTINDLEKIHSSGHHLLELINDILDLSKVEAGKLELKIEAFSLNNLLENIVQTLSPAFEKNNNNVKKLYSDALGEITSDTLRLRQILYNLLSNAAKFTSDGDITISAKRFTNSSTGHDEIMITVEDTGVGMDSVQLSRLFQPFTQGSKETSINFGGTGLGLVISKRYCELLGGDISVDSTKDQGSSFTVNLPAQFSSQLEKENLGNAKTETSTIAQEAFGKASEASFESKNTVLVIDDDSRSREILNHHIQNNGWEIISVSDSKTGLAVAQQFPVTLIILDLLMPKMDGLTILKQLKTDSMTNHIPVIICSIIDEKEKCISQGASDYLIKPIDPASFSELLNKYLTVA